MNEQDGIQSPQAIRLNKALAQAGFCSRRRADEMIFAGLVKVNGAVVKNAATRVFPDDRLEVAGKTLPRFQELHYILLHKPPQVVSTVADPQGRPTVLDLLPPSWRAFRLYPVGRLDYFSEGLLILTNDGALAHRLMHPSHKQPKVYEVLVRGDVPPASLRQMRQGMDLPDSATGKTIHTAPISVSASFHAGNTLLTMTLKQGINRQIRRICDKLDLTILRLKRVSEGPLRLGDLPRGKFRELTDAEVAALRGEITVPPPRRQCPAASVSNNRPDRQCRQ